MDRIIDNSYKNQIFVQEGKKAIFYSYGTKIAIVEDGKIEDLKQDDGSYWKDFSRTTKRHYNRFLKEVL